MVNDKNSDLNEFVNDLDVMILAGGLGTRLNSVLSNTPKILAPINGMTFFDIYIEWLKDIGVKRIILCLGHLCEKVLLHVSAKNYGPLIIETSIEKMPLGTAGAIRNASHLIKGKRLLVMNGDTWLNTNLRDFFQRIR